MKKFNYYSIIFIVLLQEEYGKLKIPVDNAEAFKDESKHVMYVIIYTLVIQTLKKSLILSIILRMSIYKIQNIFCKPCKQII